MLTTKTCVLCGKPFETRHALNKYCSGDCHVASENDRSRKHAARFSPERRRAAAIVQRAFASGELIRKPCEVCGTQREVHAHHDDYAKPLDVRWLCNRHHKEHHRKFGPGLNAFREEISA